MRERTLSEMTWMNIKLSNLEITQELRGKKIIRENNNWAFDDKDCNYRINFFSSLCGVS